MEKNKRALKLKVPNILILWQLMPKMFSTYVGYI
jgi:hypothetical protein